MEEYKKMIAGKNYNPMTPYLISLRDKTRSLISDFNQEKDEKKKYIRRERSISECERDFYVGDIDESLIKASFKDGILTVVVPKEEDKKEEIKHISID